MSIFFHKEFYKKVVSLFITLVFLIESTLLPIVTLPPRTVSAATTTYTASADFSNIQGQKNWQYLSSSGVPMTFDSVNNRWKGNETYPPLLWNNGGHPGSNADAVRRWVAPQAGTIRITGNVRDGDPGGGDGVIVTIRKSGVTLWQQTIANDNMTGFNYELTASVYAGETIDFVINKIGNDQWDTTMFDPTIVFTDNATTAQTITISRTPATSQANPYKVGDATTFSSTNPPSLFTSNLTGTGYNQIGTNTPRIFTFSTLDLVNSGACNASTGACTIPGNWDAASFLCPANVTGTQQMTEWYTVGGYTSNQLTWYFQCSGTTPTTNAQTPVGSLDGIDANGTASGWAVDPDSSSVSISVHFYIDGAAGQGGTYAGSTVANISNANSTYSGNHGFTFSIPSQWRDGKTHALYVHGIDLSGDGSKNVLLSNAPRNFTLGTAQQQPGTIYSRSAKDGQPWDSPPYVANLTFPDGHSENITVDNPLDSPGSLVGTYTVNSVTPPAGVIFQNVNGSSLPYSQTLPSGGTITFTANFATAPASSQPVLSLSSAVFQAGIALTTSLTNTAPNAVIKGFCRDPHGQVCDDPALYSANSSGQFSHTYDTTGWTAGTYSVWATANGTQSNTASFTVIAPPAVNNPSLSIDTTSIAQGDSFTGAVTGAAPNAAIRVFGKGPDGVTAEDAPGTADASGRFSRAYSTAGWAPGTYQAWVTVNGAQSNTVAYAITAPATISISRAPDAASFSPYRVGGATTFTSTVSPSLFSADYPITGYNQIGSYSPYVSSQTSTFAMRNSGFCNTSTGVCVIPGNWSSSQLACPAGVTGVQQMSEWYTVNGSISNKINWYFECSGIVTTPPSNNLPAPTPTTAPMATLTLAREQEQVLPDQLISFSGTLDASLVAFPQGSSLFIAIPEKTVFERIEIDGRTLGSGEFSLNGDTAKIPFPQNLYDGSHPFRIILRNALSSVPQLDRRVSVWVSVIDASNKLLLKGRTASTLVAHMPTEVIGKGVSLSVPRTVSGWSSSGNCCWTSAGFPLLESGGSAVPGSVFNYDKKTYFPIREFGFGEIDITRGPFFTPNSAPLLPENIAFTLFPNDASMQKVGMSLKQFSDPLAKEFITAQYQYILGRDPSNEELSRYLSAFTQWRNPLANLMEVYNRRADVRQAVLVPRDMHKGGTNDGSPRPSWDKLLEWAATKGWQEEPSLLSFKPQTGFDNGWQLFKELWEKYLPFVSVGSDLLDNESFQYFQADAEKNPVAAIAFLCYTSNMNHKNSGQARQAYTYAIDFEFCWQNDPMVRHTAILWAKDAGWAYNDFVLNPDATCVSEYQCSYPQLATINPSGPILASMFGPGKYSEYAEEQKTRYPPAQLYYDLISSSEYAQSIQQRFRANIDSVIRLFFGRPASEDDIAWAKDKFVSGGYNNTLGYSRWYSWITPQWEPNGILLASNLEYVEEIEFVKNPRYITDDVYGIRNIQGEADAVSSRMIEMIEKYGRQELYQGDNFKRIVSGLYRLYLRRTPTDAEVEERRASGKNFGKIEFDINQSREYGKNPASDEAIRSLYRNYLGRDPSDADVAQWGDKTISTIADKIGTSPEMKSFAQAHPENAYIFPIKRIKIVKCGFFCSIFKLRLTSLTSLIPFVGFYINMAINLGYGISGAVSGPQAAGKIASIVLNSISRGFNEAGFNGKTFVQHVSIARAMAGQAGGVFSMTNVMENADPTILAGFRTMARAPQSPYFGLASPLGAITGLFSSNNGDQAGRIAQIDVSSHYGSGAVAPVKNSTGTAKTAATKAQFTKTLAQGSRGAEVLKLQKLLGEADLTFLPEYQTGYYGAKTVAAVKRFQKRNGLEPVGFVGAKTRALLNSATR